LRKITHQPCQLRIDLAGPDAVAAAEKAGDTAPLPSRPRRVWTEPVADPLVKRALDQFGAQIVHRDEDFGAAPAQPRRDVDTDDSDAEE
jgi:hypothetical protein